MKNRPVASLLLCLALPVCLVGCGKSDPEPSPARETPTPSPAVVDDGGKDFSARNIRRQANQAANSLENFLRDQDPKLREKVHRLADKVSDKLGKDKDYWREKLEERRRALGPQIEKLKEQLVQVDGDKNKEKLRDALSKLEGKSQDTDKKLSEIEAIGADAWKQFKAQLKEQAAKDDNTPPTDDPGPTPTPRGR